MSCFEMTIAVVQSVAITAAAVAAFFALNTWRKQLVGQRKVELAEQVLVKLYMARDAIKWARSSIGWVGEGASRPKDPGEEDSPEKKKWLDGLFAPAERLNNQSELFSDIATLRHRVVPYFGEGVGDALLEIVHIRRKIENACWARIQMDQSDKIGQSAGEKTQRRGLKFEAIARDMWDNSQEREKGGILENEPIINEQLDDLVAKGEEVCLPILKGK